MTTCGPGTIAVATVRGVPNVRVMLRDIDTWLSPAPVDGLYGHALDMVTDIRPLVVLDLDDPDAYGCSAVKHDPAKIVSALMATNSVAAHAIARQIEAQTKPPRIPEPGLWGVVTDNGDDVWVCTGPHRWTRQVDGAGWSWVDIIDPTLVREGLS